jgi:hypothetical protein
LGRRLELLEHRLRVVKQVAETAVTVSAAAERLEHGADATDEELASRPVDQLPRQGSG